MNAATDMISREPLGDIVDTILDAAPPPQQHAIDQAAADIAAEISTESPPVSVEVPAELGALDDSGAAWNPEIHAQGADGKGVKTAKGLWRRRRGLGSNRSVVNAPTRAGAAPPQVDETQSRAAGAACAHSVFIMASLIGGEEWRPEVSAEKNEIAALEKAWGDYFVAKGMTDFPPGLALSMAMAGYALPRFTMPITQSRMQRAKLWMVNKWTAFKLKRQGRAQATKDINVTQ